MVLLQYTCAIIRLLGEYLSILSGTFGHVDMAVVAMPQHCSIVAFRVIWQHYGVS